MIFGDLNKEEMKIARKLMKRLKKLHYKGISIKKPIQNGLLVVVATEPLGNKVISVTLSISEIKIKIRTL